MFRRDADFAAEIEAHIALEADRLIAQGVPADEAPDRARRSGIIHGVPALDPASLAGSPAVMLAVAVAASLIPARRAARVDPITALREE